MLICVPIPQNNSPIRRGSHSLSLLSWVIRLYKKSGSPSKASRVEKSGILPWLYAYPFDSQYLKSNARVAIGSRVPVVARSWCSLESLAKAKCNGYNGWKCFGLDLELEIPRFFRLFVYGAAPGLLINPNGFCSGKCGSDDGNIDKRANHWAVTSPVAFPAWYMVRCLGFQ